ncbi:MAG TPA: hypothetical protein VF746_15600 [Longimicrobium sp.]
MDLWERYLFEQHSRETLQAWARKLGVFRFRRARGGHANDGDSLDVAFSYETEEQLLSFFRHVGFQPVVHSAEPPRPVPGRPYRQDEFAAFPSIIPNTRWIEQPGHCTLSGIKVFMWCGNHRITISVHSGYDVTEEDVENAARLELLLKALPFERIEPPQDNRNCICPRYYPEFFA